MTWDVVTVDTRCGRCQAPIAALEAVLRLTAARLIRCAACAEALGYPMDPEALDAARARVDAARLALGVPLMQRAARPFTRVRPPRRMESIRAIAGDLFDGKAAASGNRDDHP